MSKAAMNYVGIDVSAKKLDLALKVNGKYLNAQFENAAKGFTAIIKYVRKRSKSAKVCVEATGIYHLELSLALHEAKNIEIMVVNPRVAKDFAKALCQRSKTDMSDARMLSEYIERMDFKAWSPPRKVIWDIRSIARRMDVLTRQRAAEKNRLHVTMNPLITTDIEVNIRHLQRRIDLLQKKGVELIKADDQLLEDFTLITTITGIAEASAIRIMGELLMLPKDMTVRQWVAHAGLDPRSYESGSSVKKKVRISKVGNAHLRHALFMPAHAASRHDQNVKVFREELAKRGKTPMQGVVAVMRKLLHTIYGVMKNKTPYDTKLFYQKVENTA